MGEEGEVFVSEDSVLVADEVDNDGGGCGVLCVFCGSFFGAFMDG